MLRRTGSDMRPGHISPPTMETVAPSLLALGLLYRTSDLAPPDDDEAEQWLEAASKQGLADATNALGLLALYPIAERRKSDPAKALRYFREAADNGSTFALANLGDLFYNGKGVTRRSRARQGITT